MERPDVDGPVAHVAERHAVLAAVFAGEGEAGGERQVLADDGVAAVHEPLPVEIMHGTAQALRAARGLAEEFRHAGIRARAAGQRVTVGAVGGDKVIVRPGGRHGTGDHRLLADVEVAEAADAVATLVLLGGALLETADEEHLGEHP